jgi:transposase
MFSYVDLEERVPASHPLRKIREFVNAALAALDAEFAMLYSADGRPSIAPERLLRAALIQILFSIRSERQLMEQMQYNLLFRWFVGLGIDDPVWVPTVFTKNRDRLLNTNIARQFLAAILAHKDVAPLLSDEHFSVDGTLIDLGVHEKLSAQGWDGRKRTACGGSWRGNPSIRRSAVLRRRHACGGQRAQCRSELSRTEALQRNARLRHRS